MNEKDLKFLTQCPYLARSKIYTLEHSGVTFIDSQRVYIGEDVEIGAGTLVWPSVVLLGKTKIGKKCEIGLGVVMEDATVEDGSKIAQNCKIESSHIGQGCKFELSCYIANSSIANQCTFWPNVSAYHADIKERVTVHRDSRIVWSSIGEGCNIESYCPIKYAIVEAGCEVGPNAFIQGEKFDEETLATGHRSITIGHSCVIGFGTHIHGEVVIKPETTLVRKEISTKRPKAR